MAENIALALDGLPTLGAICEAPEVFVGKLDVGSLNLLSAVGLPGAEDLDIAQMLWWLDDAAQQVDLQVRNRFDEFAHHPSAYNNSLAYFCCNYLLRTLQELCGVQYNPARVTDSDFQSPLCISPDFHDSRDLFIHGMIDGPGGTCASMPVMYVAVGRRLGYPLKLVEAPGHLFFRWDDPEGKLFDVPERFNVEGAGRGISFYPDDFYRGWPSEWRPADEVGGWYLKSLSPAEELAAFLALRGSCLQDNGRMSEAIQAFEWASNLSPTDVRYGSKIVELQRQELSVKIHQLETERQLLADERMLFAQLQRQLSKGSLRRNPPHADACQCLQCQPLHRPLRQPGHPVGCPCPMCH